MLIVLLEYIDLLVLVKNETTIREGLTCPLPLHFIITIAIVTNYRIVKTLVVKKFGK